MTPMPPNRALGRATGFPSALRSRQTVFAEAFATSCAAKWHLLPESFGDALERSIHKHFADSSPVVAQLQSYVSGLHLADLALACACAEGLSPAWDFFVASYQPHLRSAAAAILRCSASSPAACDLADSLIADLYGLNEAACRRSLFRYFHGRSSLKTWLRAVLAQRHIDSIRSNRRFTSLEDEQDHESTKAGGAAVRSIPSAPPDPDRQRYLELFRRTLEVALGLLDPGDKNRLRLYYAEQQTLAEIGKALGEHESSVSRNLERIRSELRHQVEQALRKGVATSNGVSHSGLTDAQIELCFEYATEDAPIDLEKLFPAAAAAPIKRKGREP
jgi:RNA polymerase sigma-70 factor, ECF subfamily